METLSFPSKQDARQLELLYSYNRIPVRLLDRNGDVFFCSGAPSFLKEKSMTERFPALFPGDRPVAICEGPSEMMAAFLLSPPHDDVSVVIGPVLLDFARSADQPFLFIPSDADPVSVIDLIPVVSIRDFILFVRMMFTRFTCQEISLSELLNQKNDRFHAEEIPKALIDSAFKRRENEPDRIPYERELLMLHVLRTGRSDDLSHLPELIETRSGLHLSDDPLRQALHEFVILITILTRAAIENGMEEESSFNLCEAYISRVDGCRTLLEISSLLYTAVSDYTEKILASRQRNSYSSQIVSAVDYIYRHLHEVVSLNDLSSETGLTPSYLSFLFKKETGLTVSEYIQQQRIEEAKNLLRFSDYRIAEISSFLTFSSQSYFTSVFRKHTGSTPKKYRETHYQRSQ